MKYKFKLNKRSIVSLILIITAIVFLMTGCADATNVEACLNPAEHTYGFWGGVWHGMITFFSFVGSLIWEDVAVYAHNNNGGWYDFGFVGGLGVMVRFIGVFLKGLAATFK